MPSIAGRLLEVGRAGRAVEETPDARGGAGTTIGCCVRARGLGTATEEVVAEFAVLWVLGHGIRDRGLTGGTVDRGVGFPGWPVLAVPPEDQDRCDDSDDADDEAYCYTNPDGYTGEFVAVWIQAARESGVGS